MAPRKGKVGSPSPASTPDRRTRAFRSPAYPKQPKIITIHLTMRHSRNGVFYGPGAVRTTEEKAKSFLNTEHEAQAKELSLVQERAFIIGFQNGVPIRREVPAAQFDNILTREELPMGSVGNRR